MLFFNSIPTLINIIAVEFPKATTYSYLLFYCQSTSVTSIPLGLDTGLLLVLHGACKRQKSLE